MHQLEAALDNAGSFIKMLIKAIKNKGEFNTPRYFIHVDTKKKPYTDKHINNWHTKLNKALSKEDVDNVFLEVRHLKNEKNQRLIFVDMGEKEKKEQAQS